MPIPGPPVRLDQLLVHRGLFASRERARRAVMAGAVEVDGRRVDKPGTQVGEAAAVAVVERGEPYVSRGGRKLEAALDALGIDPAGAVCLDVGASTGGFTDCLLQRGAARVYAVDVGYGQLDYRLRTDPRVVVMERVNVRYLPADALPEPVDLVTVDVSFISLTKVVPALLPHLKNPGGELLALVKPQFEAGRGQVGKGGIVRDEEMRRRVVRETAEAVAALGAEAGLQLVAVVDSAVPGTGGNVEAFAYYRVGPP
jgi:23S rRNA (cytidine1920-2'-O)/16S rRNA (cytidine1409-2'-O)-methyltransferase